MHCLSAYCTEKFIILIVLSDGNYLKQVCHQWQLVADNGLLALGRGPSLESDS
jgi:hypothetical protein